MNVWLAEEEQFYIVTPGSGQFGGILSFVLIGPPQLFPFRPRPEVVETVCTVLILIPIEVKYSVQERLLPHHRPDSPREVWKPNQILHSSVIVFYNTCTRRLALT